MTLAGKPRSLIINTPYLRPGQHRGDPQNDGSLPIVPERRRAGYEIFDPSTRPDSLKNWCKSIKSANG